MAKIQAMLSKGGFRDYQTVTLTRGKYTHRVIDQKTVKDLITLFDLREHNETKELDLTLYISQYKNWDEERQIFLIKTPLKEHAHVGGTLLGGGFVHGRANVFIGDKRQETRYGLFGSKKYYEPFPEKDVCSIKALKLELVEGLYRDILDAVDNQVDVLYDTFIDE